MTYAEYLEILGRVHTMTAGQLSQAAVAAAAYEADAVTVPAAA